MKHFHIIHRNTEKIEEKICSSLLNQKTTPLGHYTNCYFKLRTFLQTSFACRIKQLYLYVYQEQKKKRKKKKMNRREVDKGVL